MRIESSATRGRVAIAGALLGAALLWPTVAAATCPAPPLNLAIYNSRFALNWFYLHPYLLEQLELKLEEAIEKEGGTLTGFSANIARAPGFPALCTQGFTFELPFNPAQGKWSISVSAHFEEDIIFGLGCEADLDLDVTEMYARVNVTMDDVDPLHPVVLTATPEIDFETDVDLDVDCDLPFGWLEGVLDAVEFVVDNFLQDRINDKALEELRKDFEMMFAAAPGHPDIDYGRAGCPPIDVRDSSLFDFGAVAQQVEQRILDDHLPWGGILEASFDADTGGSVVDWNGENDSALWTGFYLAAEAFRYQSTADPLEQGRAVDNMHRALDGIDRLIDVAAGGDGTPQLGLLARYAVPLDTPTGQRLLRKVSDPTFPGNKLRAYHLLSSGGQTWIGAGKITRDQYNGVMFGLWSAYSRVSDPAIRARAAAAIVPVAEYLLRHGYVAAEPMMPIEETSPGVGRDYEYLRPVKESSESFVVHPHMMMAFANVANMVDPIRFEPLTAMYRYLSKFVWFPLWADTMDTVTDDAYFKFNLDHAAMAILLETETDPLRFQDEFQGFRILRKALEHHQNAFFNAVEILATPGHPAALVPETYEELRRWSERPERHTMTDTMLSYHCNLERAIFTRVDGEKYEQARCPVPVEMRVPNTFLWQVEPFRTGAHEEGEDQNNACRLLQSMSYQEIDEWEDDCRQSCFLEELPPSLLINCIKDCIKSATNMRTTRRLLEADLHIKPRIRAPGVDYLLPFWMLKAMGF